MNIEDSFASIIISAGVRGKPFEAQIEDIIYQKSASAEAQASQQVLTGRVYRDAYGRIRKDLHLRLAREILTPITFIYDPLEQIIRVLNAHSKTVSKQAVVRSLGAPGIEPPEFQAQAAYVPGGYELGEKIIEGLLCRGFMNGVADSITEIWYSNELQEILVQKMSSKLEEKVTRLFNIHRTDPDSSLFSISEDYLNVETAAAHPKLESTASSGESKRDGEALMYASYNGNIEIVRALLAAGADINGYDEYGETSLFKAAEVGRMSITKELLENGADVNARTDLGMTVLMRAALSGYVEITEALLDAGADVNTKNIDGETAITFAAFHGHTAIVKMLLERGADVNSSDNNGTTVLMRSSAGGDTEMVRALLGASADVHAKSRFGHTALGDAILTGQTEIAQLLKEAGAQE